MRKQLGLSLVELMISITLGLVLMTGVVQMFLSSKLVYSNQQALSRLQETGRLAMDFLARDVRMAAYYGCFRITGDTGHILQNSALQIGGLHEHFDVGVMGYDSTASLPHGAAADLGASVVPVANSDILIIRGATQVGNIINTPSTTNNVLAFSSIPVDASGCVSGICPAAAAVVSDCSKAQVFLVNSVAVAGTTLTVNHTASWTNNVYSTGQVMPMNTIVYFLATGAGGGPSLWQRINNGTALELLDGVEKMRITYATANNNGVLDQGYRVASAITASNEWAKVTSIRIDLLVRSLENNVVSEPQPYTFGGVTVNPAVADPADRHLREVFSSVVTIRSRMSVN